LLLIGLAISAAPLADGCADLRSVPLGRDTVEAAALVDGDVCKVDGVAHPVAGSNIRFELWLPAPRRWSGRYYQIGNGGFAGSIHEPTLAEGAARGDAIAATDTGHRAGSFDARWAKHNQVAIDDYGWRSIKATSDVARALLQRYYGRPASRHYAIGCSNGGRMALMAAARWPDEWDGVIAGAPAVPWVDQLRSFASLQALLRSQPEAWIDPKLLPDIRAAALKQCPRGTVRDGIALQPARCGTGFAMLRCRRSSRRHCLTRKQLASLAAIVRAGYLPAAMVPSDWQRWIFASSAQQSQLTFATQAADTLMNERGALDVPVGGLRRFVARGGKIISYFGWADAVIAPRRGIEWYEFVARSMARRSRLGDSYRLFMVPGMIHCQGGEGPTQFGQSIDSPGAADDPRHDIRRALEAWVERADPPHDIVAVDATGRRKRRIVPWAVQSRLVNR
jgi:feruloyl esterase